MKKFTIDYYNLKKERKRLTGFPANDIDSVYLFFKNATVLNITEDNVKSNENVIFVDFKNRKRVILTTKNI